MDPKPIDLHIQIAEGILEDYRFIDEKGSPIVTEIALREVTCHLLLAIAKSLHKITEKMGDL
ncbi:hypothetical protein LCGC14_1462930 [marine sediment metagenome]|uniref:Uncharacterized protein n=1 Tax=marine sediment metagenome TaxID=412755 RepID=A0A0F9K0K7_9ZZZZ|nr:hypothetical protein [Candidatus Aminicenantes bacterium]